VNKRVSTILGASPVKTNLAKQSLPQFLIALTNTTLAFFTSVTAR
jgi:hypothetical protein